MTYAESLERRINRHIAEIRELATGLTDDAARRQAGQEWSAREVLLHLIGDTVDVPAGIRRAVSEDEPEITREQRGGEYLTPTGGDAPDSLVRALIEQLEAIKTTLAGLEDASLARAVAIGDRAGVPVGLWVRDVVGPHFQSHVEQLKVAIARART